MGAGDGLGAAALELEPGPARISSALASCGSWPCGVPSGTGTTTSGVMPTPWIQVLSGVSHLAIESRKPPLSLGSWIHCWMVPLPNGLRADERGAPGVLERAGEDLAALAEPPLTSTTSRDPGSVAMPPGWRAAAVWLPSGVLLPVDGPGADELAGDAQRRVHEAAGVVAQVEHEAPDPWSSCALSSAWKSPAALRAEAGDLEVADGPVGERRLVDVLRLDDVAGDRQVEGSSARARGTASPRCCAGRGYLRPTASTVETGHGRAVDGRSRSPAEKPAFWAGELRMTPDDIKVAARAERRCRSGPWRRRALISAPMPSNSPLMPDRLALYSSEVMYEEKGSSSAWNMPLIEPSTSCFVVSRADVLGDDLVVGLPERIEEAPGRRALVPGDRSTAARRA